MAPVSRGRPSRLRRLTFGGVDVVPVGLAVVFGGGGEFGAGLFEGVGLVPGRRRIGCPVLVLWSAQGALGSWYDPLAIWHDWASDVQGHALPCGHFLPEEAPDETYAALHAFFGG